MKKIALICACLMIAGLTFADTILIPTNVKDIKCADYSTGGGDTPIVYVKVLCQLTDDSFVMYMSSRITASGLLGMSRFSIPSKITFVKSSEAIDKIIWK